jgi:CIC family chloride channel protein
MRERMLRFKWGLVWGSLIIGLLGAAAAQLFGYLLRISQWVFLGGVAGYKAPALPSEGGSLVQVIGASRLGLIPLSLVTGALAAGLLVARISPESRGLGTNKVIQGYRGTLSSITMRMALVKIFSSSIILGSGGAAGREGPMSLFGAWLASAWARTRKMADEDRHLLLLVGAAAGMAALFRAPLGAAVFAVEVVYLRFRFAFSAFPYALVASLTSYGLTLFWAGRGAFFRVPGPPEAHRFLDLWRFAVIGVAAGLVGALLPLLFGWSLRFFQRLRLPGFLKPSLGALGVGAVALFLPQVLGDGYGWIQTALRGEFPCGLFIWLLAAKLVAFLLTVTSGGPGGVMAPSLYLGAMAGGLFCRAFGLPPAPYMVAGMAGVFGSAARVPLASTLLLAEMAGGYHLLVPVAVAVAFATLTQSSLASLTVRPSLYAAQGK